MRELVQQATTVICVATQLHTIATGNMTPSYLSLIHIFFQRTVKRARLAEPVVCFPHAVQRKLVLPAAVSLQTDVYKRQVQLPQGADYV